MMNKLIHRIGAFVLSVVVIAACSESEVDSEAGASFESTASEFFEGNGDEVLSINIIGFAGTSNEIEFSYGGTATRGQDFEVIGYADGVLGLKMIDDNLLETNETITIRIKGAKNGVGRIQHHLVNLASDCLDTQGLDVSFFEGDWDAVEDYGSTTYGPYELKLVQDDVDETRFDMDNFYDSGCDAYLVFDFENGTVKFPDQNSCGVPISNSTGTFNIDLCDASTVTINLNFDGGDWVYRLSRK